MMEWREHDVSRFGMKGWGTVARGHSFVIVAMEGETTEKPFSLSCRSIFIHHQCPRPIKIGTYFYSTLDEAKAAAERHLKTIREN